MPYAVFNPKPCANCGPAQDGNRICTGRCAPVEVKAPDDFWLHVRGCDCGYCKQERAKAADERRAELLREHARLGISGH